MQSHCCQYTVALAVFAHISGVNTLAVFAFTFAVRWLHASHGLQVGICGDDFVANSYNIEQWRGHGLISKSVYDAINTNCNWNLPTQKCQNLLNQAAAQVRRRPEIYTCDVDLQVSPVQRCVRHATSNCCASVDNTTSCWLLRRGRIRIVAPETASIFVMSPISVLNTFSHLLHALPCCRWATSPCTTSTGPATTRSPAPATAPLR